MVMTIIEPDDGHSTTGPICAGNMPPQLYRVTIFM